VHPKVFSPLILMAAWVAAEVWVGSQTGLWETSLLSETVTWAVVYGFTLLLSFDAASRQPDFFRRRILAALTPLVLIEVTLDAFVLSLPAEVALQIALVVLALLAAVPGTNERYRRVQNVAVGLLVMIIFALMVRALFLLVSDWHELDKGNLLLEAILPAWLTIGLLPFIYIVALVASYELAFLRISWNSDPMRKAGLDKKLALLAAFHLRAHEVGSFAGPWPARIAEAASFRDARRVLEEFRAARRESVS